MKKKLGIKRLLKEAEKAFFSKDYKKAIFYYSLILKKAPENRDAKIGILLSDLATEESEEAIFLYEYYQSLKDQEEKNAEKIIEEIIKAHDLTIDQISGFVNSDIDELEEGITYNDFKKLIESRGSFKRAFEDIMFSTKVIIYEKKDFLDFLENLIKNGFEEMAFTYLEDANILYPTDSKIREMFEKIKPLNIHHDS